MIHSSAASGAGPRSTRSPTLNTRSRLGSNASVASGCEPQRGFALVRYAVGITNLNRPEFSETDRFQASPRPSRSNSPRHREHRHPGAEQPTRTGYRRYGPRGPPLAPRPALRGDLRPTAPAVRALGFNPRPRAGGAGCVIPTSIPRRCFSPRPREGRLLRCAATGANQIRSTTSSPFGRAPASTCTA